MEEPIRVSVRSFPLAAGDRFVLCSDGLTDVLGSGDIAELLRLAKQPDEIVSLMIQQANAAGGPDNIAVLVIACEAASNGPILQRFESFDRPRIRRPAAPSSSPADEPETTITSDESENLESAPEIVIMSEGEPELEYESPIHVVPADSASEGLMDALEDFAWPSSRSASREHAAARKQVFCESCGALMDADADKCEGCGTARAKS
jgi:hypothetical protein